MKIEHLTWDSDFFGFKIGKINFNNSEERLLLLLKDAKLQDYRLIYVFTGEHTTLSTGLLNQWHGKLIDRKIVYRKAVNIDKINFESNGSIISYETELSDKLLDLTFLSGQCSRFKLDKNFPKGSFEKMYKEWMVKSLSGELADRVFVAKEKDEMLGFVTLKIKNSSGEIGLIAVDKKAQGKGIGTQLISACEKYLSEKSILNLKVPTQLENSQACRFYEKYGFIKQCITNIYHFWL